MNNTQTKAKERLEEKELEAAFNSRCFRYTFCEHLIALSLHPRQPDFCDRVFAMKCFTIFALVLINVAISFQDDPQIQDGNYEIKDTEAIDLSQFNESIEIDIVTTHVSKSESDSIENDLPEQKIKEKEPAINDISKDDDLKDSTINSTIPKQETNFDGQNNLDVNVTSSNNETRIPLVESNNTPSLNVTSPTDTGKASEKLEKPSRWFDEIFTDESNEFHETSSDRSDLSNEHKPIDTNAELSDHSDTIIGRAQPSAEIKETLAANSTDGAESVSGTEEEVSKPVTEVPLEVKTVDEEVGPNAMKSAEPVETNVSEPVVIKIPEPILLKIPEHEVVKPPQPDVQQTVFSEIPKVTEPETSKVLEVPVAESKTVEVDEAEVSIKNAVPAVAKPEITQVQPEVIHEAKPTVPVLNESELSKSAVPESIEEFLPPVMDDWTREFSEKYRKSQEAFQNDAPDIDTSPEKKTIDQPEVQATLSEHINSDQLKESGHCPADNIHCSGNVPELKEDHQPEKDVVKLPEANTISETDHLLTDPVQLNEVSTTIDIAKVETISEPDVVIESESKEVESAAPEVMVDVIVNDTLHREIGDPLGEVYFGILKEYLCKFEVIFEKTPRATLITLVVGVLYIILVTLKMVLRKKSKESQLSVELSNLQSVLHKYSIERHHYNKILMAERQKSQSLEDSMNELTEKFNGYNETFEKIKSERKLFEHECTRLKAKLNDEQEIVTKINQDYTMLSDEFERMKVQSTRLADENVALKSVQAETESSLMTAQTKVVSFERTIEELLNEKETLLAENQSLSSKLDLVTEERDELLDRKHELECDLDDLKVQLKRKNDELETLNKSVQELEAIKGSDDPGKQIHDVLDMVQIRVKLSSLEEENELLTKKVDETEEKRKQLALETSELREKSLSWEETSKKAVEERNEAVKNLEVLTKYFKEREVEMQRELGAQQVRRMQKEEDATSLGKRLQGIEEENNSYKSQCESMRKELADTERSYKTQMAILEKRAHESWVASRNFEREVTDLKRDAAFLRQQLSLMAKNPSSSDGTDGANGGSEHGSYFEFMPPPPPPGPLPPSMDFLMNHQRPSSSASGPWDLGPMPPPPPMPPLGMPFMQGMPAMPPFNPHTSYSDYSNRMSPSSRQSHSPAYSYTVDVGNGEQSSLDYSSLNFSQSQQPLLQQQNQLLDQQQHQQPQHVTHEQQQYHYQHHDQSNC